MSNIIQKALVFMAVVLLIAAWVGIEKLIERRELKELIEKNSTKNKKDYIKGE
jgi:Na+-transporting methylmalonyl-CoA/oxaloacetate decarboxylase gamma subunit